MVLICRFHHLLLILFMNSESKSKFNLWLSEHPESFHPSDEAWMFDFVNSLYETEGNICIDEIFSGFTKSHPAYSKEEAMRLYVLQRFHQYNEERGNQAFSDTYWYYFDKAEVPKLNIN